MAKTRTTLDHDGTYKTCGNHVIPNNKLQIISLGSREQDGYIAVGAQPDHVVWKRLKLGSLNRLNWNFTNL